MWTTLDIDADVLAAAKELARGEGKTVGACVSELIREVLHHRNATCPERSDRESYGFRAIPAGRAVVSITLVNELREDLDV